MIVASLKALEPLIGRRRRRATAGAGGRRHPRDRARSGGRRRARSTHALTCRWSPSRRARPTSPRRGCRPVRRRGSATQHLLDLGHQNVWHISGPSDWLESRERVEGWRATLQAAGVEPPAPLPGDWSARAGYDHGRRLSADPRSDGDLRRQRPDGARRAARDARGRARVPDEVSVVGFDDIPEAPYFTPPLTTVRQDFIEVGSRSLRLLVRTIETGDQAPSRDRSSSRS